MTNTNKDSELTFTQLALNTSDMAATLRLYSDVFGFANGGAQCIWGKQMCIQGLDESARADMWWMVGRQKFNQLELFHHTSPMPRPKPAGWRPCDIGWSRFGISVPNLDVAVTALAASGITPITPPTSMHRVRRTAFLDPYVGAVIEILEESPSMPGGVRNKHFDLKPAIIYVTNSVTDIDAATQFYRDILKLELLPLDMLHAPEDEAIWGLKGVKRKGFVVNAGDTFIEVVQYIEPQAKPRPKEYRLCDQGIMNIALGSRDPARIHGIFDQLDAVKRGPKAVLNAPGLLAAYLNDPEREIELFSVAPELDAALGFVPVMEFFGAAQNGNSGFTITVR